MDRSPLQTRAQVVMDAFESRPNNFGPMRDASTHARVTGPCGDTVDVWLRIDAGKIRKGSFMSDGCGYSVHCCSTAVQLAVGMRPEDAAHMTREQVLEAAGPIPPDHRHCALLAANTIRETINHFHALPEKETFRQKLRRIFQR